LHAGWPPVCSSIFQVLLKSVQWFCRCGWSKIALPHYFGHWLIKQLVLPYSAGARKNGRNYTLSSTIILSNRKVTYVRVLNFLKVFIVYNERYNINLLFYVCFKKSKHSKYYIEKLQTVYLKLYKPKL